MMYLSHIAVLACIFAVASLSQMLITGMGGLFALSQAAIFGVGAYVYAVCTVAFEINPWLALALASLGGGLAGIPLAIAGQRLRGDMFALASMALGYIYFGLFYNWHSSNSAVGTLSNMTNGAFGIRNITRLSKDLPADSLILHLVIVIFALALTIAGLNSLLSSPWGRAIRAFRDDYLVTQALGKSPWVWATRLVTTSGAIAGLAGALYASYVGFIDPEATNLGQSFLILAMAAIGGMYSVLGAVAGACLLVVFPELLRLAAVPGRLAADINLLMYGALLVLVGHLRPGGLVGRMSASARDERPSK